MAKGKRTRQNEAEFTERQRSVFELIKEGLSYRAIGARLNVSHETVRRDAAFSLKNARKENADLAQSWVAIELARLDALHETIWQKALAADPIYIDRALKIAERRARLLGLDKPVKNDLTINLKEMSDEQLEQLVAAASNQDTDGGIGESGGG